MFKMQSTQKGRKIESTIDRRMDKIIQLFVLFKWVTNLTYYVKMLSEPNFTKFLCKVKLDHKLLLKVEIVGQK